MKSDGKIDSFPFALVSPYANRNTIAALREHQVYRQTILSEYKVCPDCTSPFSLLSTRHSLYQTKVLWVAILIVLITPKLQGSI